MVGVWFGQDELFVHREYAAEEPGQLWMHLRGVAMLDTTGHPSVLKDPSRGGRPFFFDRLANIAYTFPQPSL